MRVGQNLVFWISSLAKVGLLFLRLCIIRIVLISNCGSGHVNVDVDTLLLIRIPETNSFTLFEIAIHVLMEYSCLITLMLLLCRYINSFCVKSMRTALFYQNVCI